MAAVHPSNRRIDRVLAPEFLDGLTGLPLDEVRRRRDEAAQEESDQSYLRRLVQGRADIITAELRHREGSAAESLVDELPHILADAPSGGPRGLGRHLNVEPSRADAHRRYVEALVADVDLSDVTSLTEAELSRALETFRREEARLSETRRAVQQVVDACAAEIGRRYREGEADVSALLRGDAGAGESE